MQFSAQLYVIILKQLEKERTRAQLFNMNQDAQNTASYGDFHVLKLGLSVSLFLSKLCF